MKKNFFSFLLTAVCCLMGTQAWAVDVANLADLKTALQTQGNTISITAVIEIPANTTETLDLNGCTITDAISDANHTKIFNISGSLTISDGTGTGSITTTSKYGIIAMIPATGKLTLSSGTLNGGAYGTIYNNGGSVEINGGKITGDYGVNNQANSKMTINNGTVVANKTSFLTGQNSTLYIKDGNFTGTKSYNISMSNNSTVTIDGGTFNSVEGCIITGSTTGSTVTINGGTFTASDNAVLAGNGSKCYYGTSTVRTNPNTFIINGGTFNGKIKSNGYVACGIYAPWKDNWTLNGGTFNITGGCGILARAGHVNIPSTSTVAIHCTGLGSVCGKVGDSRVSVYCVPLEFDALPSSYPGLTDDAKITVAGGTYTSESEVAKVVKYVSKDEEIIQRIEISGGKYDKQLANTVCAVGYKPTTTAVEGYYGVESTSYQPTVYAGSETSTSPVISSVAQWETIQEATPNAVAFFDKSDANQLFSNATKNVVVKQATSTDSYYCPNFELTDLTEMSAVNDAEAQKTNFAAPYNFTVHKGTYTRKFIAGYNSLCVPFDFVSTDYFNENEVMSLVNYSETDNTAYFQYVNGDVSAGMPVIVKLTDPKEVTFNITDATISKDANARSNYNGVFKTTTISASGAQYYGLDQAGVFHPAADNAKLYPFRAVFALYGQTAGNAAPRLAIMQPQSPTGLDELNAQDKDEKFFQNGKLYIRHNGQVFDAAGKIVK